jgi:hypothetical protein
MPTLPSSIFSARRAARLVHALLVDRPAELLVVVHEPQGLVLEYRGHLVRTACGVRVYPDPLALGVERLTVNVAPGVGDLDFHIDHYPGPTRRAEQDEHRIGRRTKGDRIESGG